MAGERDHIVDYIVDRAQYYDVLALQEVHCSDEQFTGRFVSVKEPGHRPGPVDLKLGNRLIERLKKTHRITFVPHFKCTALHDYEATDLPVQYGNMLLVNKKRVQILRNGVEIIHGNGGLNTERLLREGTDVIGRAAARTANVVTIMVGKSVLTIAAVHGLHSRLGKIDTAARFAQSGQIARAIASQRSVLKLSRENPATMVIGDLNYTSSMEALEKLLSDTNAFGIDGGSNLNAEFSITDGRSKWYPADKPTREAGFVLVSKATRALVADCTANPRVPSDHAEFDVTLNTSPGTH